MPSSQAVSVCLPCPSTKRAWRACCSTKLASFNRHWHRFDLHFGFDELTGKVQLYAQILAAQLTLECFEATLANLLDHAEFWQRLLPCDSDREAVAAVGMRV